jgi:UPF0716 protein FxsA
VFLLGILVFIGAEIASFVVVAEQIGFLWALAILVVVSSLGPFIVRRVGLGVLAQIREKSERGEVPAGELLDGLLVLIAGVMICVPGFIGDALGLLLMVRPLRRLVIRAVGIGLARRIQTLRLVSWHVADPHPRTMRYDSSLSPETPKRQLGSGDNTQV